MKIVGVDVDVGVGNLARAPAFMPLGQIFWAYSIGTVLLMSRIVGVDVNVDVGVGNLARAPAFMP